MFDSQILVEDLSKILVETFGPPKILAEDRWSQKFLVETLEKFRENF